jgi:hypothetical protein
VPLPPCEDANAFAARVSSAAREALAQAAAASGGQLLAASAAATSGSVHVVVSGALALPRHAVQAMLVGGSSAQQALQHLLTPTPDGCSAAGEGLEVQLVLSAAGAAGAAQQHGTVPGLVTPLCVVCPGGAGGPRELQEGSAAATATPQARGMGSVQVTIQLNAALLQEAGLAQGQQVRVLLDRSTASGSSLALAECLTATIAASSSGSGTQQLSLELQGPSTPVVLLLHLLPTPHQQPHQAQTHNPGLGSSREAAAPAQPPLVHPLASLPLLCLPYAAAQECLQLFSRMTQQVQEASSGGPAAAAAGGAAGASAAGAASFQAFTQHYAAFALEWAWLLAHNGGEQLCPAAEEAAARQLVSLLRFLSVQGMPACLQLACEALESKSQQLAERVVARLGESAGPAAASQAAAGGAAPAAAGAAGALPPRLDGPPRGAARRHRAAEVAASDAPPAAPPLPQSAARRPVLGALGAAGAAAAAAAAAASRCLAALPARLAQAAAPSALLSRLPSRSTFPDPATEGRYRHQRDRQMAAGYDGLLGLGAAALHAVVYVRAARQLPAGDWQLKVVALALALEQAPFLLRLVAAERYARHRQRMLEACVLLSKGLLVAAGASACLLAVPGGLEECAAGRDAMTAALGWMMLLPVVQHSMLRPSLPLTACQFLTPLTWGLLRGWRAAAALGLGLAVSLASWAHARWADELDRRRFASAGRL